jgi:hypothetical protein
MTHWQGEDGIVIEVKYSVDTVNVESTILFVPNRSQVLGNTVSNSTKNQENDIPQSTQ